MSRLKHVSSNSRYTLHECTIKATILVQQDARIQHDSKYYNITFRFCYGGSCEEGICTFYASKIFLNYLRPTSLTDNMVTNLVSGLRSLTPLMPEPIPGPIISYLIQLQVAETSLSEIHFNAKQYCFLRCHTA
jgi:hypothetical protein